MNTEPNSESVASWPELMVESELVWYLRLPEIAEGNDYHNVIVNLKRMRDLPCIHICRQPLYPLEAVREWIGQQVKRESGR